MEMSKTIVWKKNEKWQTNIPERRASTTWLLINVKNNNAIIIRWQYIVIDMRWIDEKDDDDGDGGELLFTIFIDENRLLSFRWK